MFSCRGKKLRSERLQFVLFSVLVIQKALRFNVAGIQDIFVAKERKNCSIPNSMFDNVCELKSVFDKKTYTNFQIFFPIFIYVIDVLWNM